MVERVTMVRIEELKTSPFNVRKRVGDLTDLKRSIESVGLLQPILVRPVEKGYEVVVGQRRYLACKELGFKEIPAVIKELADREALELSLIENVQAETIDPIDRAEGVKALIDFYSIEMPKTLAMETVAKRVGKSVQTLYTWLEVLKATEAVKEMVREKKIDVKTAAAVASLPPSKQEEIAKYVVKEGLNEKKTRAIIAAVKMEPEKPVVQVARETLEELEEYSITVSMPAHLYRALMDQAKKEGATIPEIVRRAVANYVGVRWP